MIRLLLLTLLAAGSLCAQFVQVYSEFRRVGPTGEIVSQDQGGRPREILSPLLARNSHATFHVVVEAPAGEYFYLFVGTNPDDVFEIKVYKELWHELGQSWVPDRLFPVDTPYASRIPGLDSTIPGEKAESFLMDVFVPKDLAPGRYKLEPQVSINGTWAVYPMEVRVSDVVAPDVPPGNASLPSASESSDTAVLGPLRAYLCGEPETTRLGGELTIRSLIRRNVLEDLAIARRHEPGLGLDGVASRLLRGLQVDRAGFCAAKQIDSPMGPEWFLRARDYLYRGQREWY